MLLGRCRRVLPSMMVERRFVHRQARSRRGPPRLPLPDELVEFNADDIKGFNGDDIPSGGHLFLHQQRQVAYYLRLIENELPQLVAFRKPFVPPTENTPLVVRSVDYAGEEHPLSSKRSVVIPVAHLRLRNNTAIHKLKLLAGVRWTTEPPKNAGLRQDGEEGEHGYIKISCEDFPRPEMNLGWISDTIDKLVVKANEENVEPYDHLPLDTRHIEAKVKKAKKGNHARGRNGPRPSLRDFPEGWLPQLPAEM
ncbi:mitochondrial ribosomal subunit protein-domain-containing protein [Phlebopus sp. FC_14]|nr:mitochondrial ribosomal subunit protein-domain-containing protein [Phlebopus sp. FC_14]